MNRVTVMHFRLSGVAMGFALALSLTGRPAYAQRSNTAVDSDTGPRVSDLAADNLSLVAASEPQIAAVLNSNPGLLVELKRWAAQDAADRGQILVEADLSDDRIFTRLTQDQKFRAAATRLLQRYGFFLPQPNPDSPAGREQDALETARIRQMLGGERNAPAAPTCSDGSRTTEKDEDASPKRNCAPSANLPGKTGNQAVPPATPPAIPPALPGDRDLDQMLVTPPVTPSDSLVRAGSTAVPESVAGAGFAGAGEAETGLEAASFTNNGLNAGRTEQPAIAEMDASRIEGPTNPAAGEPPAIPAAAPMERSAHPEVRTANPSAETRAESETPELPQHASPYSDIPSLYDMFAQNTPHSTRIERFGADVFENAPETSGTIPIDFPASPDYVWGRETA